MTPLPQPRLKAQGANVGLVDEGALQIDITKCAMTAREVRVRGNGTLEI